MCIHCLGILKCINSLSIISNGDNSIGFRIIQSSCGLLERIEYEVRGTQVLAFRKANLLPKPSWSSIFPATEITGVYCSTLSM